MAPLPDNLTRRVYFDYVTSNAAIVAQEHTLMWRHAFDAPDPGAAGIQAKFVNFLDAWTPASLWAGWRVTGVRVSEGGNDFSVPVPLIANLAAWVGTGSTASAAVSSAAIEAVFVGRSPLSGRRARFSLYGRNLQYIPDFRITDPTPATAAVAVLNAASAPRLVAVDNTVATWYPYVNYNYNSYWESELRV